jgi:hypothetical protein
MNMKTRLNLMETQLKEAQRLMEESVGALQDAETLLNRAVRTKAAQDEVLPLFEMVAQKPRSPDCSLNLMIACLLIVCSGTFDQKLAHFLYAFDTKKDGFFRFQFLEKMIFLFHQGLYALKLVHQAPIKEEVHSIMQREFINRGLSFAKGGMTQYETKEFLISLFGLSKPVSEALGVKHDLMYGTYQRNKMTPFALWRRCMITTSTCRYRQHYELLRPRPLLEREHMCQMHERALSMGINDPLKPDYTRFTRKPVKAKASDVVELTHGHLSNVKVLEETIRNNAATRIQAIIRAYIDRRAAEVESRKQAYHQAKLLAMKEMKEKILKEFQKREAMEGKVRMKWDAQVRMRQAKLRSSGQNLSRADVVMVMMEEAISRSRLEIEVRFQKIAKEEGFELPNEEEHDEAEHAAETPSQSSIMLSMFGLTQRLRGMDASIIEDVEVESTAKPEDSIDHLPTVSDELLEDDSLMIGSLEPDSVSTENVMQQIILGKYSPNILGKGETLMELEMRLVMANPDPTPDILRRRLQAVDTAFTDIKVLGFLSELPSKRLLMKYISGIDEETLEHELRVHFQIPRRSDTIAKTLKCIVESDYEFGIYSKWLLSFKIAAEDGLRMMVSDDLNKGIHDATRVVERRLSGAEGRITEGDIIESESERIATNLRRYNSMVKEITSTITTLQSKYKKLSISLSELQKKHFCMKSLHTIRTAGIMPPLTINTSQRFNWVLRVNAAIGRNSDTLQDAENKFGEIRGVCREFLNLATHDAKVIIQEHFQPNDTKSIPILKEVAIDGRANVSGRGINGKSIVYETHYITYTLCLDDHGVFNGSDEYAMKAGSLDRMGSLEYFNCHTKDLNVPLIATIDYFGMRVVAVSKLPVDHVVFSDEGDVRRIEVDQVHGVTDRGDHFINNNKTVHRLLELTAHKLNLSEHLCKGMMDIGAVSSYCSSEIKIYRGVDNSFYMKDFWRAFPSEVPEETPHLPPAPRNQSIFWRQLRPEFVKRYEYALNPDACCAISYGTANQHEHYDKVAAATKHLVTIDIPKYTESLCNRDYTLPLSEGLGLDLTTEMHDNGINMRHLGLMRSLIWRMLPGTCSLFFNENFIRTSCDLRNEVENGLTLLIGGKTFTIFETPTRKITHNRLPLKEKYLTLTPMRNENVMAGRLQSKKNTEYIRTVILAEMMARTLKGILRTYLRMFVKEERTTSTDFLRTMTCRFFNIVTGADPKSNIYFLETVYENIRNRFGKYAVMPSERTTLQKAIQPCIVYIIRRLQAMLGVHLSAQCGAELLERPAGFLFVPMDFLDIAPRVRHNMPMLAYADATLSSRYADEAEKSSYIFQVLKDKPPLFLTFSERQGTRVAENKGTLGVDYNGKYSSGCMLEESGPVPYDEYIRAVNFSAEQKCKVDTKYHANLVPKTLATHFSMEAFVKVRGGQGLHRVILMNGRGGFICSREDWLIFCYREGGVYEVAIKVMPMESNKWLHIVATYDGTTLRVYVDAVLKVAAEIESTILQKKEEALKAHKAKVVILKSLQDAERDGVKEASKAQAMEYFATKVGIDAMKDAARKLMATAEFQAEAIGDGSAMNEKSALNAKKNEALQRAKTKYATELYVENMRLCTERFQALFSELEENKRREIEDHKQSARKPLRIGCALSSLASKEGKSYFDGFISCVAIFSRCLSQDRITAHFLAAQADSPKNAQRLHTLSAALYENALLFASGDPELLRNYARSLCSYLKIENTSTTEFGIAQGKVKILEAIIQFRNRLMPVGIAEILMALPVEYQFAELICKGFLAIIEIDKTFFARGAGMTRADLVQYPRKFGLDIPESPSLYTEAAAKIYQNVLSDPLLRHAYGDIDLTWVPRLKSMHLVVAIVSQASDDANDRSVSIGKLFHAGKEREVTSVHDTDIKVLCDGMRLLVVLDLSKCICISDDSLSYIATLKSLRILNLDQCRLVSDEGLEHLMKLGDSLEVLSLAGITSITDDGMGYIGSKCRLLTSLDVSRCVQVSSDGLMLVARGCKKLTTLLASTTEITDDGIAGISAELSKKYFTKLDISFCREVGDHGLSKLNYCYNWNNIHIFYFYSVPCGSLSQSGISQHMWLK